MGKKKSVVLVVIFTIIIAVLVAMCATPSFPIPFRIGGIYKEYASVINAISLGNDLGGGYTTVYYPEGVISAEEYENQYQTKLAKSEDDAKEYEEGYKQHGGLYISVDLLVENNGEYVDENQDGYPDLKKDFVDEFTHSVNVIVSRYQARELSAVSIDILDDYAIAITLPSSVEDAETMFKFMAYSGDFTLKSSNYSIPLLKGTNTTPITTYFKSAKGVSSKGSYYVEFDLTEKGQAKVKSLTTSITSSTDEKADKTLYFYIGENQIVGLGLSSGAVDANPLYISGSFTEESAKCTGIVANSAIQGEVIDTTFKVGETVTYKPILTDQTMMIVYIVLGAAIVLMGVYSVVRYKGLGAAHIYGFLSFMCSLMMCIAFIGGIELMGSGLLAVIFSSILLTISNYYVFEKVRKEFSTGKTIASAVKTGYKTSLAGVLDVHILLFIMSFAMYFIAITQLKIFAEIFMLGIVISGLTVELLTRFYWCILMNAGNHSGLKQAKFCGFKKEVVEDDDED